MADEVLSVRTLELHELLGAAMVAVVEADALAAKATLEYVETVGFVPPAAQGEAAAGEAADGGRLRMASFRYRKRDENNEISEFVAEVPVLSLVPVPSVQVNNATFSLAIKIDDLQKTTGGPQPAAADPVNRPEPRLAPFLKPTQTRLITRPAAASGARTQEVRSTHHLEVQVTMAQADIPVGMEKVFDLMDQAIQDRKATRRDAAGRRSRLRRRLAPAGDAAAGKGGARDAPPDLRHSLESTHRGLATLLASLEQSGFEEAIGPYRDMQLVLIQQRLWSRSNGRDDLDPLWSQIADTAGRIHEILAGLGAVMEELADIDRLEPDDAGGPRRSVDMDYVLAQLLLARSGASGAGVRQRLPWPADQRRRRLRELVAGGVLERRGWGRGLSYHLTEPVRERVSRELAKLLAARPPAPP